MTLHYIFLKGSQSIKISGWQLSPNIVITRYTVLCSYRKCSYREQIVIFREFISAPIRNKPKIKIISEAKKFRPKYLTRAVNIFFVGLHENKCFSSKNRFTDIGQFQCTLIAQGAFKRGENTSITPIRVWSF